MIDRTASLSTSFVAPKVLALLENGVNRLRRAGIQAEAATFQTTGRIELVGRGREPGAGRADRNTDGLMSAAVGMADEVIANDHHGFDSFKETLGEDVEHVSIREDCSLPLLHKFFQAIFQFRMLLQIVVNRAQNLFNPGRLERVLVFFDQSIILHIGAFDAPAQGAPGIDKASPDS